MTSMFGSRQRAEAFAALVDGAADALRSPGHHTEDDRLVGVVATLRKHAELDEAAEPRAEFTATLRARLMVEAAASPDPATPTLTLPPRPRGTRERRLVAAATAAILLGGTTGMASAAQSALPGEVLYPVKRGIEKADVELASSTADRGRVLLGQASGRLNEAQQLVDARPVAGSAGTPLVAGTLETFRTQAREGADLMITAFEETNDPAALATLRTFTAHDLSSLAELSEAAPEQADEIDLMGAAQALRAIDSEASGLCPTCDEVPPLDVPPVFLTDEEVSEGGDGGDQGGSPSDPRPGSGPSSTPTRGSDSSGGAGDAGPRGGAGAGAGAGAGTGAGTAAGSGASTPGAGTPGTSTGGTGAGASGGSTGTGSSTGGTGTGTGTGTGQDPGTGTGSGTGSTPAPTPAPSPPPVAGDTPPTTAPDVTPKDSDPPPQNGGGSGVVDDVVAPLASAASSALP